MSTVAGQKGALKMGLKALFGVFLLCFCASISLAELTYSNAINASSWQLKSSVTNCSLEHNIPFYGQAVFRTRAGEASSFYLRSSTARMKRGQVEVLAVSPVWKAQYKEESLAMVAVKQSRQPLWLSANLTEKVLASLYAGNDIEIRGQTWFNPDLDEARLAISTIGFQGSYRNYLRCVASLLPQNFDQLRRTALLFPSGELDELPSKLVRKLDSILNLVKYDKTIRYFYVDGHSDSVGDRADNLALSKMRAELVAQYLQRRGVPKDWITLRWHGERYPVASNGTRAGRQKNRRVTVRMERAEKVDVLELGEQAAAN